MYSGCAEAFGMQVALIFLQHYIMSYRPNLFPNASIQSFCDNQGIITTLSMMQTTTIVHPNNTMNDDRDVYMEILNVTVHCTPLTFVFLHVKGHHDLQKNHPLTIIEQLNVNCDHKAKQYIRSTPQMSTFFGNPAIPTAQLHLWIDGKLVCHNFKSTLMHTVSFPSYGTYLKQKHHWTQGDLNQVQ